jgi:hypothetical protein
MGHGRKQGFIPYSGRQLRQHPPHPFFSMKTRLILQNLVISRVIFTDSASAGGGSLCGGEEVKNESGEGEKLLQCYCLSPLPQLEKLVP